MTDDCNTHTHTRAHTHTCTHTHTRAHTHIHTHTCTHTHTHIHTPAGQLVKHEELHDHEDGRDGDLHDLQAREDRGCSLQQESLLGC